MILMLTAVQALVMVSGAVVISYSNHFRTSSQPTGVIYHHSGGIIDPGRVCDDAMGKLPGLVVGSSGSGDIGRLSWYAWGLPT